MKDNHAKMTVAQLRQGIHQWEKEAERVARRRDLAAMELERGAGCRLPLKVQRRKVEELTLLITVCFSRANRLRERLPENNEREDRGEAWWDALRASARRAMEEEMANAERRVERQRKTAVRELKLTHYAILVREPNGEERERFFRCQHPSLIKKCVSGMSGKVQYLSHRQIEQAEYEAGVAAREAVIEARRRAKLVK
jgi:hypothetical protein